MTIESQTPDLTAVAAIPQPVSPRPWARRFPVLRGIGVVIMVLAGVCLWLLGSIVLGALIAALVAPLWIVGGLSKLGSEFAFPGSEDPPAAPEPWSLRASEFLIDKLGILWVDPDRLQSSYDEPNGFAYFCGALGCIIYFVASFPVLGYLFSLI